MYRVERGDLAPENAFYTDVTIPALARLNSRGLDSLLLMRLYGKFVAAIGVTTYASSVNSAVAVPLPPRVGLVERRL